MLRVSPCYVKFLNKLRKLSNKIFSKGKPVARIVTSWERVVPAKNRQAHSNSEVRETGSDLLVRRHFRTKMKVKVKREYFKIFCYKIHTLFIVYPLFICYVFKNNINFLSNVNFSIYYSQRIVGPHNDYNLLLHLRTPKSKHHKFLINLIWMLNIWVRFPYYPIHLPCMQ